MIFASILNKIKNICFLNFRYYLCRNKYSTMPKIEVSIPEQIKAALDGRTQRWLSFEVRIPEQELSKKMNGVLDFTPEEISAIETRLKFKIA